MQSLHDKLLCYQKKKREKDGEHHTKKYLPLPVQRKRNAFASRVGQHASIMRNQYFVNVPVNGTTYMYVKKKKSKKLQKPKQSGKRTQRQPLLPHFTNPQPPSKERTLSLTEDDVPPTYHFKKTKHGSITNLQASHPPTKSTINQANKHNKLTNPTNGFFRIKPTVLTAL